MRKRVAALVACFCFLILTVFSAGAVDGGTADGPGEPEAAVPADSTQDGAAQGTEPVAQAESGYSVVAENDGYRLYADMQTGDFALLDIAEDRLWYSGQWDVLDQDSPSYDLNVGKIKTDLVSMLAVDFVQLSTIASTPTPTNQNSYAYCVVKDNVTVQTVADGYRADYYFEDVGITIPVEILLKEDGLSVRIIGSEIQMGEEYWVTAIQLLPGFMAGDDRYDGYLFVPSGSGALIELNAGRGSLASYSQMVYGDDAAIEVEEFEGLTQNILVPVYGMKYGDGGITAIITQGDGFANICADSNSLDTSFSRVYCEYVTAIVDDTTLFESNFENQRVINGIEQRESFSDFQVDFTVMGSGADYSRMAQIYREYLIENGLEKRAGPFPTTAGRGRAAHRRRSPPGRPAPCSEGATKKSPPTPLPPAIRPAGKTPSAPGMPPIPGREAGGKALLPKGKGQRRRAAAERRNRAGSARGRYPPPSRAPQPGPSPTGGSRRCRTGGGSAAADTGGQASSRPPPAGTRRPRPGRKASAPAMRTTGRTANRAPAPSTIR